MRRKIRRLATWSIAGLTFLFVMAVAGVGLYTQTEHFRLLLREQALAALRTSINGEVALERVSGSVWQQVFLDHLSIQQNGVEVLSVPRVAVTVKLRSTSGAGECVASPPCAARMVHVPTARSVAALAFTTHTFKVSEEKVTGNPDDAVALMANGPAPNVRLFNAPNVI